MTEEVELESKDQIVPATENKLESKSADPTTYTNM